MSRIAPLRPAARTVFVLCLAAATLLMASDAAFAQRRAPKDRLELLQQKHRQLREGFENKIADVAAFCEEKQLADAAAEVRAVAAQPDAADLLFEPLPKSVQPPLGSDLAPDERQWRTQLRQAQQDYAKDLYVLSRTALNAGHASFAYQLVRETAHHDPDHKASRRLLGFVQAGEEWITPFAEQMRRENKVWHDEYGWLPKNQLERYERGERFFRNQWMSAAREAEVRSDFRNAWVIETDHFEVHTNYSLERGVELAKSLEEFYSFFHQTFAGFFNTPEQMQQVFRDAGQGKTAHTRRRHVVHYYRTQQEYNQRLKAKIAQIEITNGLYYTPDRVAYFFHNEAADNSTLFHEATHQLFYESVSQNRTIAEKENFWIVEGIACYMESFERDAEGRLSVGNIRHPRMHAARYRYFDRREHFYMPLAEFAGLGMIEFQQNSMDIRKYYSEASGLAHFFMQYRDGLYRDALVEHLSQIYSVVSRQRTNVQSLAELTGVEFTELDRQYGEYLVEMHAKVTGSGATGAVPVSRGEGRR